MYPIAINWISDIVGFALPTLVITRFRHKYSPHGFHIG